MRLWRGLQDIDIYVEDTGDEAFYGLLLQTVTPPTIRIEKVVALGGRSKVTEAARTYSSSRPALFLVDGDLPWVRGEDAPQIDRLFQWDAYCIENLLIREKALAVYVSDETCTTLEDARRSLKFVDWTAEVAPLVELFVVYACLNLLAPAEPTVSRGIGVLLDQRRKKSTPKLAITRVRTEIARCRTLAIQAAGAETAKAVEERVAKRVGDLEDPLMAVSGKDHLMPLIEFHIRAITGTPVRRASLRFRLARYAESANYPELVEAIQSAM